MCTRVYVPVCVHIHVCLHACARVCAPPSLSWKTCSKMHMDPSGSFTRESLPETPESPALSACEAAVPTTPRMMGAQGWEGWAEVFVLPHKVVNEACRSRPGAGRPSVPFCGARAWSHRLLSHRLHLSAFRRERRTGREENQRLRFALTAPVEVLGTS